MLHQRNGVCCSDATVAQLVAQRIRNAWVAGSSPASGLIEKTLCPQGFSFFAFFECSLALSGDETEIILLKIHLSVTLSPTL